MWYAALAVLLAVALLALVYRTLGAIGPAGVVAAAAAGAARVVRGRDRRRIERREPKRGVNVRHDDEDDSKRHRRALYERKLP